jgi:hypothetical protein
MLGSTLGAHDLTARPATGRANVVSVTEIPAVVAVELARLRAEKDRLLRLLKLSPQQAAPPLSWGMDGQTWVTRGADLESCLAGRFSFHGRAGADFAAAVSGECVPVGVGDCLGSVADAGLGEEVVDMAFHGGFADR